MTMLDDRHRVPEGLYISVSHDNKNWVPIVTQTVAPTSDWSIFNKFESIKARYIKIKLYCGDGGRICELEVY